MFEPENILPLEFYARHTVEVAKDLLGKILCVYHQDWLQVRIVEVEAYRSGDAASHCTSGLTARNAVMFADPGVAYVYSIHQQRCLNFVTEKSGVAGAVLIRAVEPLIGERVMGELRPVKQSKDLSNGPGKLCQALGITRSDNGQTLSGTRFKVLSDSAFPPQVILASPRIGISKAQDTPWRFTIPSPFLSRRH